MYRVSVAPCHAGEFCQPGFGRAKRALFFEREEQEGYVGYTVHCSGFFERLMAKAASLGWPFERTTEMPIPYGEERGAKSEERIEALCPEERQGSQAAGRLKCLSYCRALKLRCLFSSELCCCLLVLVLILFVQREQCELKTGAALNGAQWDRAEETAA